MSLKFVQAVLRHNLAPSKVNNLLKCVRTMRSEIQRCLRKLDNTFQHVWNIYTATTNGLARVASNLSTSTALTARIKLVDRLKDFEDRRRFARQRKAAAQVLSPNGAPSSAEDEEARGRRFNTLAPLALQTPETVIDIAGRRRFAKIVRKVGSLVDPDWLNSRGRYRAYTRTLGEEIFNPHTFEHEDMSFPPTSWDGELVTNWDNELLTNWDSESLTNWDSEPLTNRDSEPLTNRDSGPLTNRRSEPLTNWNSEPLTNWDSEPLTNWDSEPLTNWNSEPLTNWDNGPLTNRRSEPLTNWNSEPLTNWDSELLTNWDRR